MTEKDEFELAEEAASKANYNPFAAARGRQYPSETIDLWWDESTGFDLLNANNELQEATDEIALYRDAVKRAGEEMAALDESDPDYKMKLSLIQKAKQEDSDSLSKAEARLEEAERRVTDLKAKFDESKVTICLQGFPPHVWESIKERMDATYPPITDEDGTEHANPEYEKHLDAEIISAMIQWTQRYGESEPNHTPISPETVLEWRAFLPEEMFVKLVFTTGKLFRASGLFAGLENAGFLAKS